MKLRSQQPDKQNSTDRLSKKVSDNNGQSYQSNKNGQREWTREMDKKNGQMAKIAPPNPKAPDLSNHAYTCQSDMYAKSNNAFQKFAHKDKPLDKPDAVPLRA